MQRRSLLRTLSVSGIIGAGVGIGTPATKPIQSVHAQSDNGWQQKSKLAASDGDNADNFGHSVSLSGDATTAVVGAPLDNNSKGDNAGSAYIFNRSSNSWSQVTKLTADDGFDSDRFGSSVALSNDGTTAVIGARQGFSSNTSFTGAAYVFTEASGSWGQSAKLAANDADENDDFGNSVAVSSDGTTALIAARYDSVNDFGTGSAYVFTTGENSWSQEAKLTADDGEGGDYLGESLALSGDGATAVIGAHTDNTQNGDKAGSAYVFDRTNNSWSQGAKITPTDGESDDLFGSSVAVSKEGMTAVIGASQNNTAYIFNKLNESWSQTEKFSPTGGDFGNSVNISSDGRSVLIGARNKNRSNPDGIDFAFAGAAYVFTNKNDSWNQSTKIMPTDGDAEDNFGKSVSMSSDGATVVIGANNDEEPNGDQAGSAYVFSQRVRIDTPSLDPAKVDGTIETHTLTFVAKNVSADGSGDEFDDEFSVTFPEEVVLEDYEVVNIDALYSDVEQNDNTLNFSVSPSGGGTTQVSVEMNLTLSPVTNK